MSYHRPFEIDAALELAQSPGIRVLAGGTDLYPATEASELAGPVLDLTGVADLSGITRTGEGWRIGATTRWADILAADLPPGCLALQEAAAEVGAVQVQNMGTIGGNLCNASPAADGVPPLLALDASVELASTAGRRVLALADFLQGPRQTALTAGEVVTAVVIPSGAGVSGFAKLGSRTSLVISIAMVAVRLVREGGAITGAWAAVGACSPVARRLSGVEAALCARGQVTDQEIGADVAAYLAPIDDIRATGAYRAEAAAELLRRTIDRVLA